MTKRHYYFFVAATVIQVVLGCLAMAKGLYEDFQADDFWVVPDMGIYVFGLAVILTVYTLVGTKPA